MSKRLTSAEIEDGKVEYDEKTKGTITYKKIDGGYEMHYVIPQPNGTNKTQMKTFYDPTPVPMNPDGSVDVITSADIEDGKVEYDAETNATITYKKIKNGYQMHYLIPQPNGTNKTQVKTFYDPRPTDEGFDYEDDDNMDLIDTTQKKTSISKLNQEQLLQQRKQQEQQQRSTTINTQQQQQQHRSTHQTLEETKRTSSLSSSSSTTTKDSRTTQILIEKQKKIVPVPPDHSQPPSKKLSCVTNNVPGGTELIYTTILTDGRIQTIIKTIYEKVEITTIEESEIVRIDSNGKPIIPADKKIVPSENPDDITYVETIQISGGVQYRYTTITKDLLVSRTTETFYEPAPVEDTENVIPINRTDRENKEITEINKRTATDTNSNVRSSHPSSGSNPNDTERRLTSDDIVDGTVIYDEITKTTTTYKKIERGYQIHTVIPQPDGTNKTETKTFFDPEPVPNKKPTDTDRTPQGKAPGSKPDDDKTTKIITSHDIEDGKVVHDEVTKTTKTYKKIEQGYQIFTTTRQTDGTEKKETHVFYDPEPLPAPGDETKPKKPQTRITEEDVEETPQTTPHGTPSQKPTPLAKPGDGTTPKRLTSHDIEDGKVVYDEVTKTTTTYKKIENGYQVRTVTRQPDGTDKTATQVFYDPEPIPAPGDETKPKKPQTRITEEDVEDTPRAAPHGTPSQKPGPLVKPGDNTTPKRLTSDDIEDGKVIYDEVTKTTTTYKKLEKGYQIHTVQRQPDGTDKTETKTFFDPEPIDVPGGKGEKTKTIEEATTRKQTITTTTTQEEIDDLVSTPYPQKIPTTQPGRALQRLTSVDIEDGKVIYDQVTKTTTTFKKIENGYKMDIVKPQPDGTNKTETKIFYDPVPDPLPSPVDTKKKPKSPEQTSIVKKTDTEDTEKRIISCQQVDDYTTIVTRRIPNGREEITTTIRPNGSKTIQIRTFYDAETVEITDTTYTEETRPGQTKITTTTKTTKTGQQQQPGARQSIENQQQQQMIENQQSVVQNQQSKTKNQQSIVQQHHQSSLKKMDSQEKRATHELRSQQTFEEVRRVTKKTQMSGESSLKLSQDHSFEESILSNRKTNKFPVPISPEDITKPGGKTTVVANKVPGGTEYIYTTILADGSIQTTIKTVYEKTEVHIYEEETQYQTESKSNSIKQQQQQQIKSCETSSKQLIESDNSGDVTTVETKKIPGGIQYHYKTITADGVLKRTTETFYDPVPIED